MGARRVTVPYGDSDTLVSISTATKTAWQILAATNHPCELVTFTIYGDSIDLDAVPIPAELLVQTTAGSGGTALTEALWDRGITHTIQLSGISGPTSEPTASTILQPFQFAPSAGFIWTNPMSDELIINTAERVGCRLLTPAAALNVNGQIYLRE